MQKRRPPNKRRWAAFFVPLCVVLLALLVSLIPKPENDLFFILRTGEDILRTHSLPHADMYSWTNAGTRWDVPEWGAFVLTAEAFRVGRFFGTWALMAGLTVTAALIVYFWLARCAGTGAAFAGTGAAFALTALVLLALSPFVQERPYAWTYVLFPAALIILTQGRNGRPRLLLWLPALCILWANLHQGVLAFVAVLGVYAAGDMLSQARKQAGQMTLLTVACAGAVCVSPYGTGIYRSVWITLRDPIVMANVTEWRPIHTVPLSELAPFLVLTVLAFAALALSPQRTWAETFAVLALFAESLLHVRNSALFAAGGVIIIGPHLHALTDKLRPFRDAGARHNRLLAVFAALYAAVLGAVTLASLRHDAGPRGLSPEGIGEAVARVPRYPEGACVFLERQELPPGLRLLSSFESGGFLLWRLPGDFVSIDGRLDVYAGRTFHDNLILEQTHASRLARSCWRNTTRTAWSRHGQKSRPFLLLTRSGPKSTETTAGRTRTYSCAAARRLPPSSPAAAPPIEFCANPRIRRFSCAELLRARPCLYFTEREPTRPCHRYGQEEDAMTQWIETAPRRPAHARTGTEKPGSQTRRV